MSYCCFALLAVLLFPFAKHTHTHTHIHLHTKQQIDQLTGKRRRFEYDVDDDPETSLDPTIPEKQYRTFISAEEVPGPEVPGSALMFQNGPVKLTDVIAIVGRITDLEAVADWRNLPSTTRFGTSETNPPMWLPRTAFKVNMRKAAFKGWPVDPKTGLPVGGEELKKAEEKRIAKKGYMISDAALDAVWDTWSGGSGIATPDKVGGALRAYRPNANEFDVNTFSARVIQGKSTIFAASLTFILIQVLAISTLFLGPFLRTFFDIDIGFGENGYCDPATCVKLFG